MRRTTYILFALVALAAAYVVKMRQASAAAELEAAKERIRMAALAPVARPTPAPAVRRAPAPAPAAPDRDGALEPVAADPAPQAQSPADAPVAGAERVAHLMKGTSSPVDGTIVYSADAQLDIGNGMTVSSYSGVMVSDEEMKHISGDLLVQSGDVSTKMANAFLTVGEHVDLKADSAETVNKDEPK